MNSLLKCHPIVPVDFVRGSGVTLFDGEGRAFLDLESGSWATVLGHSHPEIVRVLQEEAARLVHLGVRTPNHLAYRAAEAVLELTGMPLGKCSFLSSGSEAVEFAVQSAKRLRPRRYCLSLTNTYLSALGSSATRKPEDWLQIDGSACDAGELESRLAQLPFDQISCFVLETGGGSPSFVRCPDKTVVEAIARKVQDGGGLLICNEVTCGFGRTGKWFGYQHYALKPDLVAMGKGLGNGYPVSAVTLRQGLGEALEEQGFIHAQSHQNDPLGCAVALAVISVLKSEHWIERGAAVGAQFLEGLRELARGKAAIKEARGRGLLLALELQPGTGRDGQCLQRELWSRGVITGAYPITHPAGTGLRCDPPLVLKADEVDRVLGLLDTLL